MPPPSSTAAETLQDRPPVVLAVDDNAGDLQLLAEAMRETDTRTVLYAVASYRDCDRFLARSLCTEAEQPDLILLDLGMPGPPGMDALQALKAHADWQRLPVVMLTGLESERQHQRCLRLGALAVLRKPEAYAGYLEIARDIHVRARMAVHVDH